MLVLVNLEESCARTLGVCVYAIDALRADRAWERSIVAV